MPTPCAAKLSVFDLDRTLTIWPTWSPFLIFAAQRHDPSRLLFIPAIVSLMLGYKLGLLSRRHLKEAMQALMLGRDLAPDQFGPLVSEFAQRSLATNIYPQAWNQIRAERDAGRTIVIVSAAHEFYLRPIADGLGIEDVIATRSIWNGDHLSNRIDGDNCYGRTKCERMADFLNQRGIRRRDAHIRFFSDDISDVPMFEWADEAVAVNPSKRLTEISIRRGWPILDWR